MPSVHLRAVSHAHTAAAILTDVERLRTQPLTVSELADALTLRQPQTSKHLKVLREAGIVTVEEDARRRIYQLRAEPFMQMADWVDSFERLWQVRLDTLGAYLQANDDRPRPDGEGRDR
ncbi:MAG: metalloregulator ArsR/SmtB family transcription factor [Nitriliruptoraceae bacterium]